MTKKYCTKCGAELPENAKFCPNCGSPVLPDDDNVLDQTQKLNTTDNDTIDIPDFQNHSEEKTQIIRPDDYAHVKNYDSYQEPSEPSPYNNPDYEDSYEPKRHTGLIILVIIIAIIAVGFILLNYVSPETLTDHLPFLNRNTEVNNVQDNDDSDKTEKKETVTASPDATATPETTVTPKPTPVPTADTSKKGTVFVSGSNRIRVRTGPSLSAKDTGDRKYNGDTVTIYETKQAEGYTWYRIGDNLWIAGDGNTFGVHTN